MIDDNDPRLLKFRRLLETVRRINGGGEGGLEEFIDQYCDLAVSLCTDHDGRIVDDKWSEMVTEMFIELLVNQLPRRNPFMRLQAGAKFSARMAAARERLMSRP